MTAVEQLIARAPIFAGLPAAHLGAIARCGQERRVEAGRLLVREGEPAETFFLICAGAVALEVSSPSRGGLLITTLHEGELLGWSWLYEPHRWRVDGRAVSATSLLAFDGGCVRALCDADHDLGYRFISRLAAAAIERLQETRLQLLDVYANPVGG